MFMFLYNLRERTKLAYVIDLAGYFYLSLWNHIFNRIPSYYLRYLIAKYLYGLKIGKSNLHMGVKLFSPWQITIGDNCNIQMDCFIDGRGVVTIGDNIDITFGVKILSEQHDINDPNFARQKRPVTIHNNAVIGAYALILPGVTINEGCVVGSGSVVVKDTDEYCMVAGNPAVKKRERSRDIKYKLDYKRPFH